MNVGALASHYILPSPHELQCNGDVLNRKQPQILPVDYLTIDHRCDDFGMVHIHISCRRKASNTGLESVVGQRVTFLQFAIKCLHLLRAHSAHTRSLLH